MRRQLSHIQVGQVNSLSEDVMMVLDMETYSNSVSETIILFEEQSRSILRAKKRTVQ